MGRCSGGRNRRSRRCVGRRRGVDVRVGHVLRPSCFAFVCGVQRFEEFGVLGFRQQAVVVTGFSRQGIDVVRFCAVF